MKRKLCSLILTAVMLLALMGGALAETDPCAAFRDVDRSAWYHTALDYVVKNRLMSGTSSVTFEPAGLVSRAMVVQTFYAIAGKPDYKGSSVFDDVKTGDWYFSAVNWAATNKLAAGMGGGKFRPNDHVTREQLAVFLKAFAAYRGKDAEKRASITEYKDHGKVSSYANEAMRWAVASVLISGKGEGLLAPKDTATRAELAQMLYRFMSIPEQKTEPTPSPSVSPTNTPDPTTSVTPAPSVTPSPNYSVSFKEEYLELEAGETGTVSLQTNAPQDKITLQSEDASVARCNGLKLEGLRPGVCVLTVTAGASSDHCTVYVNGFIDVDEAYTALNTFRTSANVWQWNSDNKTKTVFNSTSDNQLKALERNAQLEATAKIRAKEIVTKFSHTRPDGTDCFTAYPSALMAMGENIAAGHPGAKIVTEAWEETEEDYDGQGHRRNMLEPMFRQVGIAGYMYRGRLHWVQSFGTF